MGGCRRACERGGRGPSSGSSAVGSGDGASDQDLEAFEFGQPAGLCLVVPAGQPSATISRLGLTVPEHVVRHDDNRVWDGDLRSPGAASGGQPGVLG